MAAVLRFPEDVWMAALHLVADRRDNSGQREIAGFLGLTRVEYDLEQQVAEFVLEVGHVAALARVGDFLGILDRIRRNRLKNQDGVPFATAHRIAQPCFDRDEPLDIDRGAYGAPAQRASPRVIIYIMLNLQGLRGEGERAPLRPP